MSDGNASGENICMNVCSSKEKTEVCLNLFKLTYYCSITGGIIWHLAYYGFVIGVLPDLDLANLMGYLISIFVIGIFITLFFIYFFAFPGFIVMYALRNSENTESFKKWVNQANYKIKNGYLIFLTSAITTFIFSSIAQVISRLKNNYLTGAITLYMIHLIIPVIASVLVTICCAKYIPPKKEGPSNFYLVMFLSVISFIAPITIIFLLVILPMEQIEFSAYIVMLLIGFLLAAVTNGLIATEDFIFKKEIKDPLVKYAVGFLSLIFLIITLAFCFDMYTDKRNPLIIAPFKMLRIGQVDADITLDEDYVKKSNLGKFSNTLNAFRFKILSSIGSEYIVQYPTSDEINDAKNNTSPTKYNILRIPKSKVLLVEYMDSKKQ